MAPSISTGTTHYALVVDAGSSGSRLQIYSWRDPGLERAEILSEVREARAAGLADGSGRAESSNSWWWWDSLKGKGKASVEEMELRALRRLARVGKGVEGDDWVKRVEPGISTISPEDIPGYLAPLMAHALEHIPPSQHKTTPIYVLATAGMRLLSDDAKAAVLGATCETLRRDYPFTLDEAGAAGPCGDSVRIISGEEEGIWGWVAVNYLMDGFGHAPELQHKDGQSDHDHLLPLASIARPAHPGKNDGLTPVDINHHSPTFGFLDMGGASTQLAFSPSPEELAHSRYPAADLGSVSLRLLSGEVVQWPVFAASWLGFGTNRVRESYIEAAVKEWTLSRDPDVDVAEDRIVDACLPVGLVLPSPDTSKHPDFIGAGNFAQCLRALKPLLATDAQCPAQHCLFGGIPTPHIDFARKDQRGFIGISEYWYTAQQVLGLGGVWDWAEWERGMSEFCAQDWTQLEAKLKAGEGWHGTEVEISRLQMQCFKGAWISNVLHEGIGIPRLGDAGGNDTLTGGKKGETNAEAEQRAREKGLYDKPHFQSMDEVGETAISWTLGKVVIEASKAVGSVPQRAWRPSMAMADLDRAMWGYVLVAAAVLMLLLGALRRRGVRAGRKRKPGRSATVLGIPIPFTGEPDAYAFEESGERSGDLYGGRRQPAAASRLRLWSRRVTQALRRNVSFGGLDLSRRQRHASMPLSANGYSPTSGWHSQPSSPRGGGGETSGFSTSAYSTPVYSASARNFSMMDIGQHSPAPGSPPRRAPRPRTNSAHNSPFLGPQHGGGGAGWNDPPMSMFGSLATASAAATAAAASATATATATAAATASSGVNAAPVLPSARDSSGDDEWPRPTPERSATLGPNWTVPALGGSGSGVLTPSAGPGGDHVLSRNSSRVNLSEIGLAQRSRANTPHLGHSEKMSM